MLSDQATVQGKDNQRQYVYTLHSGTTMNEEERDTFRFDIALCLLVGIVIAFYLLNILFK